jgi:uncharacterized protein (TIGR03435 family)
MKKQLATLLLAATCLLGQSAKPDWEEFSIGLPTEKRTANRPNGIRSTGLPLKRIVARAYGVPEHRISGPEWMAEEFYALTAIVSDPKDFRPFLQQELTSRFRMSARREPKEVAVFVLKVPAGAKPEALGPGGSAGIPNGPHLGGSIKLHGTVTQFADSLGDIEGRPVLDETNMEGTFDFHLKWNTGSDASLQKAVKDQLGLELTDERRVVDLVIVDHIEKLQFPK